MDNNFGWELDKNYIAHHQVKGAHWGIMNGPPYPLGNNISTGKRLKSAAKGVGNKIVGGVKNKIHQMKKDYSDKTTLGEKITTESVKSLIQKTDDAYRKSDSYKNYSKFMDDVIMKEARLGKRRNGTDAKLEKKVYDLYKDGKKEYFKIQQDMIDDAVNTLVNKLNIKDVSPSTLKYGKECFEALMYIENYVRD